MEEQDKAEGQKSEETVPEDQAAKETESQESEPQPEQEESKPEPVPEPLKEQGESSHEPKESHHKHHAHAEHKSHHHEEPPKTSIPIKKRLKDIYEHKYKKLLIIPFLLLILAFAQMGVQFAMTGDFINRGISLKGGISLTIPTDQVVNTDELFQSLQLKFPDNDLNVRTLSSAGISAGIIIEADFDITDDTSIDNLITSASDYLKIELSREDYTIEGIGSSLGASFFREAAIAMLIAFLFMGIVVFIYFRSLAPSLAVILAAFSDIIITIAVVNLIGIKMSTSGIVGLLLLIGYSVDTDILLSTKVLKMKEGTVMERIYSAMKTGMTMTASTFTAVLVALIFSQSIVIKQIMLILLIGLVIDVINTYIQNVGLLRLFLEHKK